ncbi:MAG TPA: STAS domain-containing protein [Spirochaetota bacterium]|nr:STAS domain-containing protein [Spirochaetota bacterium]HOK92251.1 STAS domain-containing protein [Spirochaetota bacterium]HON16001.1 STAS domain-containing protein [Spirochaetota bacterium]HPD77924.1 STAS domain-containing protein [Spirochaetota bacterium]HPP93846.1 STAS domain-containing protein [Spirochaetota bacterium]
MEKITIQKAKNLIEIHINGNLNIHSIDLLENKFRDVLAESGLTNTIIVNCEKLDSIDSSGLGMLISLSKQTEKKEIDFYLYGLSRKISALFDISNLDKYFKIISEEEYRSLKE